MQEKPESAKGLGHFGAGNSHAPGPGFQETFPGIFFKIAEEL